MTTESAHLSSELVVLAARLVRDVRRRNTDVPAASTRVLSLLDEVGPATVTELAAADRCSQPTMTGHLRTLADAGLVRRQPHPADARATLVGLSPEGEELLGEIRRRNGALVESRLAASRRTPEELAVTVAVLSDLLNPDLSNPDLHDPHPPTSEEIR